MAGIDLSMALAQLQRYLDAETAVLGGQEYKIGDRMLKRADLPAIQAGIDMWNKRVQRLSAMSSGRSAAIVPCPR